MSMQEKTGKAKDANSSKGPASTSAIAPKVQGASGAKVRTATTQQQTAKPDAKLQRGPSLNTPRFLPPQPTSRVAAQGLQQITVIINLKIYISIITIFIN